MQTGITVVIGIPPCRTMNIRTLRGCVQCDAIRSANVDIFQGKCPSETGIGSRVQHDVERCYDATSGSRIRHQSTFMARAPRVLPWLRHEMASEYDIQRP